MYSSSVTQMNAAACCTIGLFNRSVAPALQYAGSNKLFHSVSLKRIVHANRALQQTCYQKKIASSWLPVLQWLLFGTDGFRASDEDSLNGFW